MRNFLFALAERLVLLGLVFFLAFFGCKKEPLPHPIYGEWETVNAVGFKWEYNIQEDGFFCRSLPEYFGETKFCYNYQRVDDTLFIQANSPERWTLQIQTRDAILVTSTLEGGNVDAFLLNRKK